MEEHMKKPISPRLHGALDYATAATAAVIPWLSRMSPSATRTAETWAASYAALSAFTDYPLALRREVPFEAHGTVDKALGLVIPALPWLLGFARDRRARNFFMALAGVSILVTALTNWNDESPQTA
jgi:hypothetical protein